MARVFRIDPAVVLAETDPLRSAVRVAAMQWVLETEKANKDRKG